MQINTKRVGIGKAAEMLGVSTRTLIRWEEKGYLVAFRTLGGHRRYCVVELEQLKHQNEKR